jgi:DNA helicase II / ATP-dependent DNA helicase PcrA
MSNLLENLNREQEQAVKLVGRNLLIIAGAGSGKTRVLTRKIAFLIQEHSVKPHQILAMTFSNRAAKEMKDRIAFLLSGQIVPYWVGTFHSACVKLLREFIHETSLKPNFTIYDEDDQASVIKESLGELNYDEKKYKPRSLVELFSRCKNEVTAEERYFERETDRINIEKIYEKYSLILKRSNAIDFGGILVEALNLIKKPHINKILSSRWKYILIDEYQDTNRIQRELLRKLKADDNYVCAVGDDDQSIYMWRGATVENILSFENDFADSALVKLERNYRSTKKILEAANSLIKFNSQRMGKILITDNPDGEEIEYYPASDERDEAAHISAKIDFLSGARRYKFSDIAVFYRTHAQSRAIEEALIAKSIPYKLVGGTRFYDRKEVKDIIAYLKFLSNKSDSVSFKRIVNLPPRGIGKRTLEMLDSYASSKGISQWEVIKKKLPFDQKGISKFEGFVRLIEMLDESIDGSVFEIAKKAFELSGYKKMLELDTSYESEVRLDNIKELLGSIKTFEQMHHDTKLTDYLETVSLLSDADSYEGEDNYVTLMTVHCSKGLEFRAVFVTGLEDGLFPHQNSFDEYAEMEEERRLLYVAMTRAMEKLYLTNAFQRRVYATASYRMPSRFLEEIDPALTQKKTERPLGPTGTRIREKSNESAYYYDDIPQYEDDAAPYRKGLKVKHPQFGEGVIKQCEKSGDHWRLTINFKLFGMKKIVPDYVDLEII